MHIYIFPFFPCIDGFCNIWWLSSIFNLRVFLLASAYPWQLLSLPRCFPQYAPCFSLRESTLSVTKTTFFWRIAAKIRILAASVQQMIQILLSFKWISNLWISALNPAHCLGVPRPRLGHSPYFSVSSAGRMVDPLSSYLDPMLQKAFSGLSVHEGIGPHGCLI